MELNLKTLLIILSVLFGAVVLFVVGQKLFGSGEKVLESVKNLGGVFVVKK